MYTNWSPPGNSARANLAMKSSLSADLINLCQNMGDSELEPLYLSPFEKQ